MLKHVKKYQKVQKKSFNSQKRHNNRKCLKVQPFICQPSYVQSRPKIHRGQYGPIKNESRVMDFANALHGHNNPRVKDLAKHKPHCPEIAWDGLKWLRMSQNGSEWLHLTPNMAPKGSKLLNIAQNCFKLLQISQNCSK